MDCFYWVSFSQPLSDLSTIDQVSFIASFFGCKEAFLGQESEWFREAQGCSTAMKSRNFRAFSGAHLFCIILADKQNCSYTDEYFLWDRSKILMRCSSILLQRHGNLWGSTAFVVVDSVCLLFIKLFVDSRKPQYVAQTSGCSDGVLGCVGFGFWGMCVCGFSVGLFLIFLSVDEVI